jgi:hypothetical protein
LVDTDEGDASSIVSFGRRRKMSTQASLRIGIALVVLQKGRESEAPASKQEGVTPTVSDIS